MGTAVGARGGSRARRGTRRNAKLSGLICYYDFRHVLHVVGNHILSHAGICGMRHVVCYHHGYHMYNVYQCACDIIFVILLPHQIVNSSCQVS